MHSESITFLRGTNLVLGAGCIVLFSWCHRVLESGGSGERIAQFAVFPIIFPYFFVIYTDIPSLFVVLAGLWLCLRERYALGCLALALSLGVRQNNIVWVVAIPLLCWLRQTHFDLSCRDRWSTAFGPVRARSPSSSVHKSSWTYHARATATLVRSRQR